MEGCKLRRPLSSVRFLYHPSQTLEIWLRYLNHCLEHICQLYRDRPRLFGERTVRPPCSWR